MLCKTFPEIETCSRPPKTKFNHDLFHSLFSWVFRNFKEIPVRLICNVGIENCKVYGLKNFVCGFWILKSRKVFWIAVRYVQKTFPAPYSIKDTFKLSVSRKKKWNRPETCGEIQKFRFIQGERANNKSSLPFIKWNPEAESRSFFTKVVCLWNLQYPEISSFFFWKKSKEHTVTSFKENVFFFANLSTECFACRLVRGYYVLRCFFGEKKKGGVLNLTTFVKILGTIDWEPLLLFCWEDFTLF